MLERGQFQPTSHFGRVFAPYGMRLKSKTVFLPGMEPGLEPRSPFSSASVLCQCHFPFHKLAPIVSPNKTWEGSIGGFVFTGIGMAVLWKLRESQEWYSYPDWSVLKYFLTGAVLSIASQVGDLTESAMKRDADVKDSGSILL